jgi:xanthine dehydrogenase YagR molybdenum-binding subunit
MSTIAKGTIKAIDTAEALRAPGVIRILTDENYPKLAATAFCGLESETSAERIMAPFPALQSNKIVFNMQPIALVLAETFEQARYAARLVKATYKVKFELGNTKFPAAPVQGGSFTTASVGTAIYELAQNIRRKLLDLANKDATSPLKTAKIEDVEMLDGKLQIKNNSSRSVNISELMRRNNLTEIVDIHASKPSPEREKYATAAHGAQFVEVKIDPDLGTVRVTRVIEVSACGKIMNPKTSHSQEIGGIVWGISMALQEATEVDHRYGRIMNPNLQHYHVPVNADILAIETIFVEEDDKIVNPLGVKGMGELGMVGIPAAIANAVFHATGKRIRDLPITPDKLL